MTGQQSEAKLVNEWLLLNFPNSLQWKRVRLGPLPDKKLAKLYSVTLRWADAIAYKDGVVYLIEAKLKPTASALGQLLDYKVLFPDTPEFEDLKDKQIKLIFLTTRLDESLKRLYEEHNIKYEVYNPPWFTGG